MSDPTAAVRQLLRRELGADATRFDPIAQGATVASKWLVHVDNGSRFFVKTAQDERGVGELLAEQRLLRELPSLPAPKMLAVSADPPITVMEDHSCGVWDPAFTDGGALLARTVKVLNDTDAPGWLRGFDSGPNRNWPGIAADPEPFLGLGLCSREWLDASIDALIAAEQRADPRGGALVHGDLHGGNVCYAGDRALLVDWGNARAGNPNITRLCALIAVRIRTGTTPDIRCDDPFAWASYQAGRHVKMSTRPRPSHIRADSALAQRRPVYLRHVLEWAVEAGPLGPPAA
jgi:hypothetical protein